jgi:hypothetical protein
MHSTYVVTGTLVDGSTIALDELIPMPAQRVRLTVEPIESEGERLLQTVLAAIRARQTARGHQPPTRAEIDQYLELERASWD